MSVTREVKKCFPISVQTSFCWSGHCPESIATRIL